MSAATTDLAATALPIAAPEAGAAAVSFAGDELPPALWLILGSLTLLALVGTAAWALWLAGAASGPFAEPGWRFLCH